MLKNVTLPVFHKEARDGGQGAVMGEGTRILTPLRFSRGFGFRFDDVETNSSCVFRVTNNEDGEIYTEVKSFYFSSRTDDYHATQFKHEMFIKTDGVTHGFRGVNRPLIDQLEKLTISNRQGDIGSYAEDFHWQRYPEKFRIPEARDPKEFLEELEIKARACQEFAVHALQQITQRQFPDFTELNSIVDVPFMHPEKIISQNLTPKGAPRPPDIIL